MLKKKFIFENDDENEENEKSDFQKILDLNKKRVHYSDVYFETSDGNDFSNVIETSQDGLIFTFDGLDEYLKFFFPEEYGEDNTDGEWDRQNYDYMYRGVWNWYDDFYDRSTDDWGEGYIVDSLKKEHLELVRDMSIIAAPSVTKQIIKTKEGYTVDNNKILTDFLTTLKLEDELTDTYINAQVAAVSDEVPKGIEDAYCNCLSEIGIERYSQRYCFWKYELDWGSCILLFARFGTTEDRLLDLLFEAIKKIHVSHLPEYYEMQYIYWNRESYDSVWVPRVTEILENKLEELQSEVGNTEYFEVLDKIIRLGGFESFIDTKDKKHQITIKDLDPETLKITYTIRVKSGWGNPVKKGITDIDSIINMINVGSLFDRMDYR